ncbi:hypothetical protein PRZ48_011466 [Zasmidium cellare]|uniref:Uncharacterized protein n=1 Tax=Zasmidium cellare TaxID=395010 RepID=A0ABR0E6H1_ZASCE|nr:hypothetical protein PRZ48_011466 [Zasmidium cellare]
MATSQQDTYFHVVEQCNAANNSLVRFFEDPQDPLPPQCVRARTRIISMTANNISYTKSNLLGWWHAYPIPDSLVDQFPRDRFMHAPGWGFAEVVQSDLKGINPGDRLFGYHPFSNHSFTLALNPAELEGHFYERCQAKSGLVKFYRRCHLVPAEEYNSKDADDLDFIALMRAIFGTGYDLANYVLAWKAEERVEPAGPDLLYPWDKEVQGDVKGAVVVVFGAAGKAAVGFAHQLKHGRPNSEAPALILGVASSASSRLASSSGLYEAVYTYDEPLTAIAHGQDCAGENAKFVLVDFSSHDEAAYLWADEAAKRSSTPIVHICLTALPRPGSNAILVIAPHTTAHAIDLVGAPEYYKRFENALASLSKHKEILHLEPQRKFGLDSFKEDFDKLARGAAVSSSGTVYHM